MSTQHRTNWRSPRFAGLTFLAVTALALTACSGGGTTTANPTTEEQDGATGACGTVPYLGVNDPDGLLDDLGDIADYYNGFPYPVLASPWADWKPDHAGPYTAGIVMNPLTNPFQQNLHDGLVSSLEDAGIEIIADLAPPTQQDVPVQLQQFQQVLSQEPDIIFFGPIAADAGLELVTAAGEAGIPVVSMHNATNSEYAVSVGFNNVLNSMELGAGVLAAIDGTGTTLRVHGVPGIAQDEDASTGFDAVMKLCPDVTQEGEVTGLYQTAVTQQAVVQFLATHPSGVDAVFQSGVMGLGVLQAFEQSGQVPAALADPGSSKGTVNYAKENPDYPFFGSATPSTRIGETFGEVGARILAGQGPKINQFVVMPQLITQDNIDDVWDETFTSTDPEDVVGDEDVYFPKEHLDLLFNNPDLQLE